MPGGAGWTRSVLGEGCIGDDGHGDHAGCGSDLDGVEAAFLDELMDPLLRHTELFDNVGDGLTGDVIKPVAGRCGTRNGFDPSRESDSPSCHNGRIIAKVQRCRAIYFRFR